MGRRTRHAVTVNSAVAPICKQSHRKPIATQMSGARCPFQLHSRPRRLVLSQPKVSEGDLNPTSRPLDDLRQRVDLARRPNRRGPMGRPNRSGCPSWARWNAGTRDEPSSGVGGCRYGDRCGDDGKVLVTLAIPSPTRTADWSRTARPIRLRVVRTFCTSRSTMSPGGARGSVRPVTGIGGAIARRSGRWRRSTTALAPGRGRFRVRRRSLPAACHDSTRGNRT